MPAEDISLAKIRKLIETKLGWGDSDDWTNQDFLELSSKILEQLELSVSHVDPETDLGQSEVYQFAEYIYPEYSRPICRLSGLERFQGENLRRSNDGRGYRRDCYLRPAKTVGFPKPGNQVLKPILYGAVLIGLATSIALFVPKQKKKIDPNDYSFSTKEVLKAGVPNSVIFDYNATNAPTDSVIIQQSWNTKLRTKVSKDQHQHTLIYYFPGFFKAKLVVDNQIVKERNLLIKSDGWMAAVESSPMPVYFKKEEFFVNGKMSLPADKIKAQNISFYPQAPELFYSNVQDFGEIYSDNFVFETSLRNDFKEGSSVCQMTHVYLLCEGTAVGIPLCARGCESNIDFFFAGYSISGKQKDLSGFGVDFNDFVKLRIESVNAKAKIFLNDKLSYEVDKDISKSKIIGILFAFQGTGTVDYLKLSNKVVSFEDGF